MICGPLLELLSQLFLTQVTSSLSLNIVWFSVSEVMVHTGQTDRQRDRGVGVMCKRPSRRGPHNKQLYAVSQKAKSWIIQTSASDNNNSDKTYHIHINSWRTLTRPTTCTSTACCHMTLVSRGVESLTCTTNVNTLLPVNSEYNTKFTLWKEAGPPPPGRTDDDCEQQLPTVAVCLQQLSTPAVRPCCAWCDAKVEQDAVFIFAHYFVFKTVVSHQGSIWQESKGSNRISSASLLTVFWCFYVTTRLSCLYDHWTDNGRWTDNGNHCLSGHWCKLYCND